MLNIYLYGKNKQIVTSFIIIISLLLIPRYPAYPYSTSSRLQPDSTIVKSDSLNQRINQPDSTKSMADTIYCPQFSCLNRQEINLIFYEDQGDLIIYLPGVSPIDPGNAGQKLAYTRHGNRPQQSIVYFDSRRFYDPISGEADLNFLPVGFTNHITLSDKASSLPELISGEALRLYSEKYQDELPYSQIFHHKASLGYSDVDFLFGQPVSQKTDLLVGGMIKSYDGKNNAYLYDHQNLRAKLAYHYNSNWQFEYSFLHNKINRNEPGFLNDEDEYSTPNRKIKDNRYDHTLNLYGKLFHHQQNFRSTIYYSSLYTKITDQDNDLRQVNRSRYGGTNFKLNFHSLNHTFSLGGNVEHIRVNASPVGEKHHSLGSIFIGDQWHSGKRMEVSLNLGTKFHERWCPRYVAGLNSSFLVRQNLRFSVGGNQRIQYPTFFELYARTNYVGNQLLNPEVHQKLSITLNASFSRLLEISASAYLKKIKNSVDIFPLDTTQATFVNSNPPRFWGMDLRMKVDILSGLSWHNFISYIDNQHIYNQPEFNLISYFQYQNSFFENDLKTFFRIETRWIGKRNSLFVHPDQYRQYTKELPSVFLLNGLAVLNFSNLNIFLMFENILNQDYDYLYGFPMHARTFHYGIRWEFWN